jgi:hypothetical protein
MGALRVLALPRRTPVVSVEEIAYLDMHRTFGEPWRWR